MYEEAGNTRKVDEMIILALDNYSDKMSDSSYEFLSSRTLEYETIMRYQDNEAVLCLLARLDVSPTALVSDLIFKNCGFSTIYGLVKNEKMFPSYLERKAEESKNPFCYLIALKDKELKNINYNTLLNGFLGLEANLADEDYLNCVEHILTKIPYEKEIHLELAKKICSTSEKCVKTISNVIDFYLWNETIDFEETIKERPDLLLLFEYCRRNPKYFNYNLNSTKYETYYLILISKIKVGKIKNVAWIIHLHEIDEESRINILNYWASTNQIVAFETYFSYFTSDTLDYENIGRLLDEEYNKTFEEQPDEPMARTRNKKGNQGRK